MPPTSMSTLCLSLAHSPLFAAVTAWLVAAEEEDVVGGAHVTVGDVTGQVGGFLPHLHGEAVVRVLLQYANTNASGENLHLGSFL